MNRGGGQDSGLSHGFDPFNSVSRATFTTQSVGNVMKFTVNAVPIAQPRQRIRVMMIRGHTLATNYTPKKAPVQDF